MISWNHCSFAYGDLPVVSDFSFSPEGEGITVFLGPSGCGKTTLLNLAAGLAAPQAGSVSRESEQLSYLFQKPRLLPWKSVRENIEFVLPETMDRLEKRQRCASLIELVGLAGFEEYKPSRLSGGMEQRVAIARAFVEDRAILLMDEPFKGLDLRLKLPLIRLLKDLLRSRKTTVLLVTHDVREAVLLGDRIVCLDGPPLEIREDMKGLFPAEERHTGSAGFYELEKKLYSLILRE